MTKIIPERKRKILAMLIPVFCLFALLGGCVLDSTMRNSDVIVTPPPPKAQNAPGSLWPGATGGNMLFTDRKARYINDVVTVIISESSEGENNAKTEATRDATTTAGIAGITQSSPDKRILAKYELGGSSESEFTGEGKTKRDGILKGKVTARVVRVMDNGNLMIEGRRLITVNAEDQYMILTGTIRPDDISTDNMVLSQYIADARIIYTGVGIVNDKMRPGWMTRIVDWVWPF